MEWSELFIYEPESGRLINRVDRNSRSKLGEEAGHLSDAGYRITRVNRKNIRVHRIIWEMHNGKIPKGYEVDHINRVRDDNRVENLRLVNSHEQNLNLSQRKSKSGVTGVVFNKKDNRWQAQIGFKGKQIYLGQFKSKTMAILARKKAEKEYGFRNQL